MRCDAVRCGAMRCVAVRCRALRCVAVRCGGLRCDGVAMGRGEVAVGRRWGACLQLRLTLVLGRPL